jgi:hypothetical protein
MEGGSPGVGRYRDRQTANLSEVLTQGIPRRSVLKGALGASVSFALLSLAK